MLTITDAWLTRKAQVDIYTDQTRPEKENGMHLSCRVYSVSSSPSKYINMSVFTGGGCLLLLFKKALTS